MSEATKEIEYRIKIKGDFNLKEISYKIEELIMKSKFLHNRFYLTWLMLDQGDKEKFLGQIRRVIRMKLFSKKFLLALARDIIREDGTVNVESYVYKHIRSQVYSGDSKSFLTHLSSVLDEHRKGTL